MPDDPATTATLEEEVKEPPVAADFETADKPPPEVEPEAIVEIEPEKSASDRYLDDLMLLPSDERKALLSKIETRHEEAGESDILPWKERQAQELAASTTVASQNAERERRQEELRSWKNNADAARANVNWIVQSLSDQWEKRGVDDPAPRHDAAELEKHLNDYANAEAGLRSHAAITEIGGGLSAGIEEHGGPITTEEMARVTTGSRADMVKGYMGVLAERVKKITEADMNKEIEERIHRAVLAEQAAAKATAMSEVKVAPEQVQASAAAAPKAPTQTEYVDATATQRAEWKEAGIDPVPAE